MQYLRASALGMTFCFLAGCSNLAPTNPAPLFGAPDQSPNTTGYPLTADTCTNATSAPLLTDTNGIPNDFVQFGVLGYCYYRQADNKTDIAKTLQLKFVTKGLALADQTCDQFFNKMEAQRQGVDYLQDTTNTAGGALVAALSFSSNHVRAVFNTATLLTAANGFYGNYKANYILTPQLQKLRNKLQTSLRDPIAAKLRLKALNHEYMSFDDAKRDLLRYDQLCSHAELQDMVSEMVSKSELAPITSTEPLITNPEAVKLVEKIFAQASGGAAGSYTQGQLEVLYAIASVADETDRQATAKAAAGLMPDLAPHILALKLNTAKNSDIADLRASILQLGSLLGLEQLPDLASMRTMLAARAAEDKVPKAAAWGAPTAAQKAQSAEFQSLVSKATRGTSGVAIGWKVIGPAGR